MQYALTYWQSHQYSLTVDAAEIIPAVRDWTAKGDDLHGHIARTLADLEAGRALSEAELAIVAEALEEDGQVVVSNGTASVDADEPGDYTVEAVPE